MLSKLNICLVSQLCFAAKIIKKKKIPSSHKKFDCERPFTVNRRETSDWLILRVTDIVSSKAKKSARDPLPSLRNLTMFIIFDTDTLKQNCQSYFDLLDFSEWIDICINIQ